MQLPKIVINTLIHGMMSKLNYLVPVIGKIKLCGSEEDLKKSSKYFCYLSIISSWTNLNLHLCQVWLTLHGKLTILKVSNRQTNWQNEFQTTGWTKFIFYSFLQCMQSSWTLPTLPYIYCTLFLPFLNAWNHEITKNILFWQYDC